MRSIARSCMVAAGLLLLSTPTMAHHPESGLFDEEHAVHLTGIVRSIAYQEPHVTVQFEAAGGAVYTLLLPSPWSLETHGLPRGTLRVGMTLGIEAIPGRNDESVLRPEHLEFGGLVYELRHEPTPAGTPVRAR